MTQVEQIWRDVAAVRERRPLVHNITNFVVMNLTANALLALGASPIMAHAAAEVDELVGLASSLVLNLGTLAPPWIESMHQAAAAAARRGLPIVLDPVGAGASRLRTETALALIKTARPAVIRANPSEILALAGAAAATRGVDSVHGPEAATAAAGELARSVGCVVVASGPTDLITDGQTAVAVAGGSPLLPRVTGMGCTATALVGAFTAVAASALAAATAGMGVMKVASELAAARASGPGTFVPHFLDALANLSAADLNRLAKIAERPPSP